MSGYLPPGTTQDDLDRYFEDETEWERRKHEPRPINLSGTQPRATGRRRSTDECEPER